MMRAMRNLVTEILSHVDAIRFVCQSEIEIHTTEA